MPMNGGKSGLREHRYKQQPCYPHEKHQLAFPGVVGSFSSFLTSGRFTSPFMNAERMPSGTTRHANDSTIRFVMMTSEVLIANPEHGRRDVTDGRPCTSGDSRDDHNAREDHRVSLSSMSFLSRDIAIDVVGYPEQPRRKTSTG